MLAGAARSTCILGLVDRPLCIAFFLGAFTGDWQLALPLGIIIELCWLDVIELGSVVPPYAGLTFLLAFPLCRHFGLMSPGQAILPLLLSLLAACAAAWCERQQRIALNPMIDAVSHASQRGGMSPERAVLIAGLRRVLVQFILYAVSFGVISIVLFLFQENGNMASLAGITWHELYGVALLGALLSLRTRQAYCVLVGGVTILMVFIWGSH